MSREPTANIDRLIAKFRKRYAKSDAYNNVITESDLQRVAATAKPLYDLANGIEPILRPMTEAEATELIRVLRLFKVKVDRIEQIPLKCPDFTAPASWVITKAKWRYFVFVECGYNLSPLTTRVFDRLFAGSVIEAPKDLENALGKRCRKLEIPRAWDEECWLIGSLAEHLVTPKAEDRTAKKKAAQIEIIFPYLVRWHILGFKPNDTSTVYVLVP
ncbi:MAG: hypothetical protein WAZ14_02700 [Patescibacteria group bacterium]